MKARTQTNVRTSAVCLALFAATDGPPPGRPREGGCGTGTWHLAVEHPDVWAAIAPVSSGGATPEEVDLERIRHIPVLVCHGDRDGKAPVERERAMVATMKELGMTYEYFEKPGGTHAMLESSRPRILAFFDRHSRQPGRD